MEHGHVKTRVAVGILVVNLVGVRAAANRLAVLHREGFHKVLGGKRAAVAQAVAGETERAVVTLKVIAVHLALHEPYKLGVATAVIAQEGVAEIRVEVDDTRAFVACGTHQLQSSIGCEFPTVAVVGRITYKLVAAFERFFIEEFAGGIKKHTGFKRHTCLTGRYGCIVGSVRPVHRQAAEVVLYVVKLAYYVFHTLCETVAGQLEVVVEFEHPVAQQGHTAVTFHQFEVSQCAEETCFSLHCHVERGFLKVAVGIGLGLTCFDIGKVKRHSVDICNEDGSLADSVVVSPPPHFSRYTACRGVTSHGEFVNFRIIVINRDCIVGGGIEIVASHSVMAVYKVTVDIVQILGCLGADGVGGREHIVECEILDRFAFVAIGTRCQPRKAEHATHKHYFSIAFHCDNS